MTHWLEFGAACFIVIGVLMVGVGIQEYLEWRKGRE